MTHSTFTVIYRTGGTHNFKWHRTNETHHDYLAAVEFAKDIERQGYPTLIHKTDMLDAIGLPESYDIHQVLDDTEIAYAVERRRRAGRAS